MFFSSWLCTNSTKNMLVKIVHPGGHVELHDRPVLAAEIMLRNPRCCIAHPHVFKQPWAIVPPETMLMPSQKYYVVPVSTIRKLRRLSTKYSPSQVQEIQTPQTCKDEEDGLVSKSNPKMEKDGCFSEGNCFTCLIMGVKLKASDDASREETKASSSFGSSETEALTRKRTKDFTRHGMRGRPKRRTSFDHWQPSLESISEE